MTQDKLCYISDEREYEVFCSACAGLMSAHGEHFVKAATEQEFCDDCGCELKPIHFEEG